MSSLLGVTFMAVSKVILAVLAGAFTCQSVPAMLHTVKDLSFVIGTVTLPSLTLGNTALSVNLDVLGRCSILLVYAVLMDVISVSLALGFIRVVFGAPGRQRGVPDALAADVDLTLRFAQEEEEEEEEGGCNDKQAGGGGSNPSAQGGAADGNNKSNSNHNHNSNSNGNSTSNSSAPRRRRAAAAKKPYVAVVLSEALRARGIGGADVVPLLEVPSPEMEDLAGYRWGSVMAFSMQNTVTLPLSLLQNIAASVEWIDLASGTAYIFIFTIVIMLYMWGAGPVFLDKAAKESARRRLIRDLMVRHKRRYNVCDATTQTEVHPRSQLLLLQQQQQQWQEEGEGEGRVQQQHVGERPTPPSRFPAPHTVSVPMTAPGASHGATLPTYTSPYSPLASSSPGGGGGGGSTSRADLGTQTRPGTPTAETGDSGGAGVSVGSGPEAAAARDNNNNNNNNHNSNNHNAKSADSLTIGSSGGVSALRSPVVFTSVPASSARIPYEWEREGLLRVLYADELRTVDAAEAAGAGGRRAAQLAAVRATVVRVLRQLSTNPPFLSIVFGVVIGVVGPLRRLLVGGSLSFLMDTVLLLGSANIPMALYLLGINLMGSAGGKAGAGGTSDGGSGGGARRRRRHVEQNTVFPLYQEDLALVGEDNSNKNNNQSGGDAEAERYADLYNRIHSEYADTALQEIMKKHEQRYREEEEEEEEEEGEGHTGGGEAAVKAPSVVDKVRTALSYQGINKKFLIGVIFSRLVVLPGTNFAILTALAVYAPSLFAASGTELDRTLLLVLFLQSCAPTAINSALLFNARQYFTYPWAKMLFFQYVLCSVAMVTWATIGLFICSKL